MSPLWPAWLRTSPAFFWLWSASFVSVVGDAFRGITVSLWLFEASGGNGAVMAASTAVGALPTLLLGTLAGVWADRWERRRTLIMCDLLRLLCSLGLVAAALLHSFVLGLLALAVLGGVSVLGSVATETTIPRVVEEKELERANGLWVITQQVSFIVAPLGAAWVYAKAGAGYAFALDALSFGLSALLLLRLPLLPSHENREQSAALPPLGQELLTGFRSIWQDCLIRSSLLALTLRVMSAGINSVVVIFFIAQVLKQPTTDLAWLGTTNGLAQVLTGSLVVAAAHRAALPITLSSGMGLMVLGALVMALAPQFWVLIAGVILTSLGNAPANIAQATLEQRFVPGHLLGRVKGVQNTLMQLAFLLGATLAGTTIHVVGPREWLWLSAGLLVAAYVVTAGLTLPMLRCRAEQLT